ncbi:hypothetical protein ACFL1Y_00160 [Patescibacteria group bacterium]
MDEFNFILALICLAGVMVIVITVAVKKKKYFLMAVTLTLLVLSFMLSSLTFKDYSLGKPMPIENLVEDSKLYKILTEPEKLYRRGDYGLHCVFVYEYFKIESIDKKLLCVSYNPKELFHTPLKDKFFTVEKVPPDTSVDWTYKYDFKQVGQ